LLCALIVSITIGCKQEELIPSDAQLAKDTRIGALKDYFADLLGVDTKTISYDDATKMFYTTEGTRISEVELENSYKNNGPVNHYKDGVPVPRN
jgi:hypothetical protein